METTRISEHDSAGRRRLCLSRCRCKLSCRRHVEKTCPRALLWSFAQGMMTSTTAFLFISFAECRKADPIQLITAKRLQQTAPFPPRFPISFTASKVGDTETTFCTGLTMYASQNTRLHNLCPNVFSLGLGACVRVPWRTENILVCL